jgi:16S rRNA (guanine527-N7)-methyltransferase
MTSGEFRSQLARRAAAAQIDVSDALAEQLETYYQLLVRWNSRINLTALPLDPTTDQAVDRLFIEPICAAKLVPPESAVWFDVGSGGGSPAIPLRLLRQGGQLTMVESRERKAAFLREVVRALSIDDTTVQAQRIEEVAETVKFKGTADLITVRAVRIDPRVLDAFRALLQPGGLILFFGAKHEQLLTLAGLEGAPFPVGAMRQDLLMLKRSV